MSEINTREDILEDIKKNLETLTGREVSNYSVMLSALLARVGEELATAEVTYYRKWESIRLAVTTDGRAEKQAKGTEEYLNRRLLEIRFKSTREVIQSLKKRMDVLMDEERSQRYGK
jgi:hypothetical protein